MSLTIAFAQAEPAYEGNKEVCLSSDFINKTHLSCIACGLKKAGRPAPDDHYLAMMGLLARDATTLFDDESNPKFNKATKRGDSRRSINGSASIIYEKKDGPVEITAKAKLQKNTLQLLLASGYCSQGKIKPKNKSKGSPYANYIDRMLSDEAPVTGEVKTKRNLAAKELGQSNWDNAREEFLYEVEGSNFFTLPFEQQQEFYKKRRASSSGSHSSEDGYRPRSEISDCLNDIDQNYTPKYATSADAYAACTAIYNECGIATNPNDNNNTMRNGKRVGGDWCGTIYKKEAPVLAKQGESAPGAALTPKGTPSPPPDDKSKRRLGEVFMQGNNIIGPEGSIDASQVEYGPKGIFIPNGAIKLNQQQPAPASLPAVQTAPPPPAQRPAVDVQGAPRAPK